MPINVCSKNGDLGAISIAPKNITTNGNESITYTITVNGSVSPNVDISGEFRIEESDSIKTGNFEYSFDEEQKKIYSIKETQNGFTFKFSSSSDRIVFDITPIDFYTFYEAALVVDAETSQYGSETVSLEIRPNTEFIQADNFEDYQQSLGITTPLPEEEPTEAVPTEETKLDITNEYNFYQKKFEETRFQENNLLNINKLYSTRDILKYFRNESFFVSPSPIILHSKNYMKEVYPILDKQKSLFPMYIENKFEVDNSKAALSTYLNKLGILEYICFRIIRESDFSGLSPTAFYSAKFDSFLAIANGSMPMSDSNISSVYSGDISSIKSFYKKSLSKTLLFKIFEKQIAQTPELLLNEILMYKVQKFKGGSLLSTQYFINNMDNIEIIAFDTQLKYDTEYEYRVSKVEITQDRIIKVTPIDGYSAKTRIIDSPPLFPDVTFIPFKGVDNQVLINLNTNVGRYADYPVVIKDSDYPVFNKILQYKKYSKLLQNENKIQFEADEGSYTFEMYRLDKAPSSYSDFKDAFSLTINSTSILDNIEPNKKYYYILRAKDIHGNLSNPTKPIQLEIINQEGTIYMLKKEYIFGEEEKMVSKVFTNVIQLKPTKEQKEINQQLSYESSEAAKNAKTAKQINMILGNKEVSLWNKPFLMRVTSKKTGKKIDIKFMFTVSQPK